MLQELIPLSSPSRWKEALNKVPHGFGHTWESCYAMHLTTGFPTFLYIFEHAGTVVVCPIAERNFRGYADLVTPYGFSGFVGNQDCPSFPNHWKTFAKSKGYVCGYFGLHPLFENDSYLEPEEVFAYNTLYILDLQLSTEALFGNLSQNRKRQLKNYNALAGRFLTDKELLKEFFLSHYHAFFKDRNASQVYGFSIETLSYLIGLDQVFLIGIGAESKIEAVSVFGHTPYGAEYLFNISLPEGQKYTVPLLWKGIQYLKSIGTPFLNLGGGVREGDSLSEFKQRFGAQEFRLKSVKQVYDSHLYALFCEETRTDSKSREGYFPAYRNPSALVL